jgi:hypothetical protein
MKRPSSPEKIFFVAVGSLALCALGCLVVGLVLEDKSVMNIARWLSAIAIMLAFIPLIGSGIVLMLDRFRPK